MQANSESLSYLQRAARCCHLIMTQFKRVKKSNKGQHRTHLSFWCGKYPCKIMKWCWQFLQSYSIHKAAWPWASLKVQKGHTKINVKLVRDVDVENIPIKLQYSYKVTGNLWRVILFTRYWMLPAARPPRQWRYPSSLRGWGVKIESDYD